MSSYNYTRVKSELIDCSQCTKNYYVTKKLARAIKVKNTKPICPTCIRRTIELSPFTYALRKVRRRCIEKKWDPPSFTAEDIEKKYIQQRGCCIYTGWVLRLYGGGHTVGSTPKEALSVDRKDSSEPYTLDNIQLVSYFAQCAKNNFTELELLTGVWAINRQWPYAPGKNTTCEEIHLSKNIKNWNC